MLTLWATSSTGDAAGRRARRASPDFSRHCGTGRAVGLKLFAHPSVQTEVWTGRGTSQHLAALRRIGLVESRREGTSVFYSVADQEAFRLLEAGRALVVNAAEEQRALLEEIEAG